MAGDGIAAWSSFTEPAAIGADVVLIIELVVSLATLVDELVVIEVEDEVLCWLPSSPKLLAMLSIFGMMSGVGGTWLPAIAWFTDGTSDALPAFSGGGKALPAGK